MYIEKLASQIRNDIVSGLRGYHSNLSLNLDQLLDEIVATRLAILKLYFLKGIFPIKDLLMSINCILTDCKSIERCSCSLDDDNLKIIHFQIPLVISDYGKQSIDYIGSSDRQYNFNVVTSISEYKNIKYRKRGTKRPVVWIDMTPNSEGYLDCFVFNAPFLKLVSVVAAFKDPRLLLKYECCRSDELMGKDTNMSFIDDLIREKLVKEKIQFYRQYQAPIKPNDQQYVTGG